MELKTVLRITLSVVALIIYVMQLIQLYRFTKKLKGELKKGRVLSRNFREKWGRRENINIIFIIFATVCMIVAVFLRDE
ncbi:hypothetical protein QFZ77_004482 [Paenibacillus sp. V4I3]|uniref:hypothetical protein n=1 Tax=unclassified Paenibacillus TaxID=185978 RepID=UPI0027863770|nr:MULTISPECIES: hypothetical protein [unclassified Paenibacillus]MDQ0875823.1 hypothetical protein [Paenibacillus sp. V4I3]MDQ0888107.1 hypothetical protein [Paenibacillus sp. V4I9]